MQGVCAESCGRGGAPRGAGLSTPLLVLMALGCGCYLGWQLVDISPTLFPEPSAGVRELLAVWSYAATALLLVALVACALLARHAPLLPRTWLVGAAAFGPFVGTALLYASGWLADPMATPGVVAGRLLYAASAGFVVLWGEALCRVAPGRTLACVGGAYATAFAICLLVVYLDAGAALLLRTMLPLLSGGALLAVRGELLMASGSLDIANTDVPPSVVTELVGVSTTDASGRFGLGATCAIEALEGSVGAGAAGRAARMGRPVAATLPARVFVGIGVFGAIFIATNHLSETKTDVSTELYTLVSGICVSLAMLVIALSGLGHHRRPSNFALIYRLVTPLVIGCLLLTLVLQTGYQRYEALAIGLAWAFFRVMTWTLWAHVGARDMARGACAFALGQICLTLGSTLGELLCAAVDLPSVPLVAAAAVIIFVTVVTSTLVMDEGSLSRLFAPRVFESAAASSAADSFSGMVAFDALSLANFSRAIESLGLSERERHISLLVLRGGDNASICEELCITESTLRTHLRNIYAKTDVHSRADLTHLLANLVRDV